MGRCTASQAHLVVLLAACLAMTALASVTDDEAGWMLGTGAAVAPLILVAARDRDIADYLHRWPAGNRLCVVLLGVAVGSGLLDVGAEDLVSLLGTSVLIYLLVVLRPVWKPLRRRRR